MITAGDMVGAAAAADAARKADTADRYTNSMAVKALFAAGQVEAAEQTAMLFTRDGDQVRICDKKRYDRCNNRQLSDWGQVSCNRQSRRCLQPGRWRRQSRQQCCSLAMDTS
jgi:hypothetical protein